MFGGYETRAFCYISDAIDGTIKAMRSNKTNNEIVNVGNDREEVRIIDLAKLILKISKSNAKLKIKKAPSGCVKRRCPDITKIKKMTGYEPKINLEQGVRISLDWYLNKYKERDSKI